MTIDYTEEERIRREDWEAELFKIKQQKRKDGVLW